MAISYYGKYKATITSVDKTGCQFKLTEYGSRQFTADLDDFNQVAPAPLTDIAPKVGASGYIYLTKSYMAKHGIVPMIADPKYPKTAAAAWGDYEGEQDFRQSVAGFAADSAVGQAIVAIKRSIESVEPPSRAHRAAELMRAGRGPEAWALLVELVGAPDSAETTLLETLKAALPPTTGKPRRHHLPLAESEMSDEGVRTFKLLYSLLDGIVAGAL